MSEAEERPNIGGLAKANHYPNLAIRKVETRREQSLHGYMVTWLHGYMVTWLHGEPSYILTSI